MKYVRGNIKPHTQLHASLLSPENHPVLSFWSAVAEWILAPLRLAKGRPQPHRMPAFVVAGFLIVLGSARLSAAAPAINSTTSATGQVGVAFSYQITAPNTP